MKITTWLSILTLFVAVLCSIGCSKNGGSSNNNNNNNKYKPSVSFDFNGQTYSWKGDFDSTSNQGIALSTYIGSNCLHFIAVSYLDGGGMNRIWWENDSTHDMLVRTYPYQNVTAQLR